MASRPACWPAIEEFAVAPTFDEAARLPQQIEMNTSVLVLRGERAMQAHVVGAVEERVERPR
jgi:hypothetical protein